MGDDYLAGQTRGHDLLFVHPGSIRLFRLIKILIFFLIILVPCDAKT